MRGPRTGIRSPSRCPCCAKPRTLILYTCGVALLQFALRRIHQGLRRRRSTSMCSPAPRVAHVVAEFGNYEAETTWGAESSQRPLRCLTTLL